MNQPSLFEPELLPVQEVSAMQNLATAYKQIRRNRAQRELTA